MEKKTRGSLTPNMGNPKVLGDMFDLQYDTDLNNPLELKRKQNLRKRIKGG